MAGELVSFGIQKLWNLLSQESKRFQGVEDQVAQLKSDLNLLNSFLKDADAKKHTSAVVKNCIEEIKDIVYDAEDIIETYLLKEELGKTSGIKKRIRRLACIIPDCREITSDMRGISTRISKVICDMKDFGVQQIIIADGMDSQPLQERQREMRQEFAGKYESELVGLEANVKKLVGYLVEENDVQVVSITGMGGLGKTTLARQVFNHDMVKNKFDGLAWVCVSQVFNRKNVWQTILQKLTPKEKKDEILHMTEATLQEELFRLLKTSKSLIVFDDIWEEEHWDLINLIFPEKGWKVLLTSRKEIVTTRRNTINFKPECLTTEDSWTLFQMIALPRKDASELEKTDEEMEVMGKQMIKHCGGLPLAIRVLGGLLAAKYTVHDWKRVSENIGSRILEGTNLNDNNIGSVNRVLSTSFEELPSNLKNCFLYLAHFPEDYQISVEKLSYYWATEGILKLRDYEGGTIRDVGDVYIEELVRRNMVISERDVMTLRFETCHLHDMMREICLSKAKEENFLQIVGICSQAAHSQTRSTSRRFVSHNPTTLHAERDINNSKVRSLVVISKSYKWELSSLSFARLQLLRVLDFSYASFEGWKLPSSIGKLIHLRYLNLEDAWVSHLPSSLQNLKLLIYLNLAVYVYGYPIFVPNVLMGMKELRYLELPNRMDEKTKLELSNLEKLETLKNFSTENSSLDDLRSMSRLRILTITLTEEVSIENLSASIGGLRHLEDFDIYDPWFDRKIETGFIVNFVHLKEFSLRIYMPSLPKPFPSHLTFINLEGCRLEEDPMPILDKLPQLKEVNLLFNAFSGRRMDCSAGGFPQLQKLVFQCLDDWEEWVVEEGSMPLLHILTIMNCKMIKELPDGLRFITSLKDLTWI